MIDRLCARTNYLQRLPVPISVPPRYNYGTPNLSSAHSQYTILAMGASPESSEAAPLRLHCDDLPVFPDVDRHTVHTGGSARVLCSSAQRAPDLRGKLGFRFSGSLIRHSLDSSN